MRRAIALEPDRKNFTKLVRFAEDTKNVEITPVCAAAWSCEGTALFHESGNRNASIMGASYQYRDGAVPLMPPSRAAGNMRIDYLKLDVEGAESETLRGAREMIMRDRPTVLLSVYHRSEDLFALPLQMASLCESYRFYLRRTECLPAWEIALIAVPCEKK